ncbi:MAG: FtsQ-type POTRA domain-containing protein [Actinomycetota bacterium]|nr:FtsQ-type POTRA domain-containing protein [Actinomycetota bacterium]
MRLGRLSLAGGRNDESEAAGDPRLARRREQMEAASAREGKRRRMLGMLGAVGILVATWLLLFSGLFALSRIDVVPSGRGVPLAQVERTAQAYLGANYFRFDPTPLEHSLQAYPLVGQVQVRASFPHTIVVQVSAASPVLVMSPVAGSGAGVVVNARLQPMPGVAPPPGLMTACLAAAPFSGSASDFACDHGATAAGLSPLLGRVLAVLGAARAANLKPASAVVFGGYGVGITFVGGYSAYFADGTSASSAAASLAGLVKQGHVPSGSVVDLTDPAHPVVD